MRTGRIVLAIVVTAGAMAPAAAQEAEILVRVRAGGAKLIGDVVGGARITVREAGTGVVLATGVTRGGTGDTDAIMAPGAGDAPAFGTPGAAGWTARFPLTGPTRVEIVAEGPLAYPSATVRSSRTLLVAPGTKISGEGVVLVLHGLIVDELHVAPEADTTLAVSARVRMLCSCPTQPGGLWSVEQVTARLLHGDRVVAEIPLAYTGEASVYAGKVAPPEPGRYRLEVFASDGPEANYGRAARSVDVGGTGPSPLPEPGGTGMPPESIDPALDLEVSRYLRPYVEMDHFAGVALVARGDTILVSRGFGLANRELGVPFTSATRLRVGSITKDLTAVLILVLEDRGLLSRDDPLSRFLPDFPAADRISIDQLLSHRHGVRNWRSLENADALSAMGTPIAAATDTLARYPLEFEPGTQRRYGSSGYLLLARVIEKVTGMSYGEALRRYVTAPAGLASTGSLEGMEIVPGLADAYVPTAAPPWLERYPPNHPAITVGSASLFSTARDLFAWTRTDLAGRVGWPQIEQHGRTALWTSGLTAGFTARVHYFPDEDVTVVLMSNVFVPAFRPILRDMAAIVLGEPYTVPDRWTPIRLDTEQRAAVVGTWRCDAGLTAFDIMEEPDGRLVFLVDGARFPIVPRGPTTLHLPTDYATLHFGNAAERFQRIHYEGGFVTDCTRAP